MYILSRILSFSMEYSTIKDIFLGIIYYRSLQYKNSTTENTMMCKHKYHVVYLCIYNLLY